MGKHFEQVKCNADLYLKIFTDEEELTPDQVRMIAVTIEGAINDKMGLYKIPDMKAQVGCRFHVREVGLK